MLQELTLQEVFSRPTYRADYTRAKARQTCILCGRPAEGFRNSSAKLEYCVSALCQECQDRFFCLKERGEGA
ncbi:MAG: hypothetical protein R6X07_15735 [Desulfatiglandales bacterium]|jgi:hypothetical protein